MSLKRPRSPSPSSSFSLPDTYSSNPITDRQSTFTAHFSPTHPVVALRMIPSITSASHRILAWRTPSAQRTLGSNPRAVLETGCDDDGEKFAGRRVLRVLEELDVQGSVVVARWYGGVMLGPVRFTHMEDVVREAVGMWRGSVEEEGAKRRKVEEERVEREGLVGELRARDESIRVLRGLVEGAKSEVPMLDVQRIVEYEVMELERLRQIDKARDRTIAFLLKRIDEREKLDAKAAEVKAAAAEADTHGAEEKKEGTVKVADDAATANVQTGAAIDVAAPSVEKDEHISKDDSEAAAPKTAVEESSSDKAESIPD